MSISVYAQGYVFVCVTSHSLSGAEMCKVINSLMEEGQERLVTLLVVQSCFIFKFYLEQVCIYTLLLMHYLLCQA